ncbi:YeeE/YedE family protein [Planktotalea arctica]|uniref:YeeE/YedE family protein n=1 Tax=Planktotalea arctica TaxID=1481893 RepID=UPI000A16D77E|nr:YeeE/YedE thiosulfate transporter family protein [Planktotalea arctica]
METTFTPYASLGGGVLIGLASVMLMATLGRIFGATGIVAGLLQPSSSSDWSWRALLLLGMISGPLAVMAITGEMPAVQVPISTTMLVIGGFIVGIGVTLGSGCTSGHGVCGMARLSTRSITATTTFMIFTAITVYVIRHVIGA